MNYILNHKLRIVGILVLTILLGVGVYLALNPTVFRSRASGAKLILESAGGTAAITAKVGETARVYVSVDPGGADVVGVDAVIQYNAAMFDVTDADINVNPVNVNGFGVFPVKKVESPGIIRISGLSVNTNSQAISDPVQARVAFANITFHPKKDGVDNMTFGPDSVIADRNAQNIYDVSGNQGVTVTITPAFGAPTNLQVSCAYPNATLTWTAPTGSASSQYKVTYNGHDFTTATTSQNLDLSTGPRENAAVSIEAIGGGTLNGSINCSSGVSASATPPPSPGITQSPTSPYTCSVQDVLVQDATTGQAVTSMTPGTSYSLFVTMAVNGWTIDPDPQKRASNDNPPLFNYMTLFDNADQVNVPQTSCLWSNSKSAFICSWEGNLTASAGINNLSLFLRNYSGSTEVTSCTKNGNSVIATYSGS